MKVYAGLKLMVGVALVVGTACQRARPPEAEAPEFSASTAISTEVSEAEEPANGVAPESQGEASTEAETAAAQATTLNPPQQGRLTAQQATAQINLRSLPSTVATAKGYGLVGDRVQLLRVTEGRDRDTWYYVKFAESGAEGWIRGDFVTTAIATDADTEGFIGTYTTDELFAVDGGGCGISLWHADAASQPFPTNFLFFNGLEETSAWMKLDGSMTRLRRTASSGEGFYGQYTNQSFETLDGKTRVAITVTLGTEAGYESINIARGRFKLETEGRMVEIPVVGDAGC